MNIGRKGRRLGRREDWGGIDWYEEEERRWDWKRNIGIGRRREEEKSIV